MLSNALFNEFRVQIAREDRPRRYQGPLIPGATLTGQPQFAEIGGRPFPDFRMGCANAFRIGLPLFLPIDPSFDTRLQVIDNVSIPKSPHLVNVEGE